MIMIANEELLLRISEFAKLRKLRLNPAKSVAQIKEKDRKSVQEYREIMF